MVVSLSEEDHGVCVCGGGCSGMKSSTWSHAAEMLRDLDVEVTV